MNKFDSDFKSVIKEYKIYSKEWYQTIRKGNNNYYSNKIRNTNGDSKWVWSIVNSILRNTKMDWKVIIINCKLICVNRMVANAFHWYFHAIPARVLAESLGLYLLGPTTIDSLDSDLELKL